MRRVRLATVLACTAPVWGVPATAAADEARSDESVRVANVDTTYGRIDGDVGVAFGAGVALGPSAPRGALDARLRYLDTAGLFVSYEDGLSATSSNPRRVVAAGFELRPLFLARWLSGREWGIPRLDLFIDSLGLELGAVVQQPVGGAFVASPGLQASVGLEAPILASANGPWIGLHAGERWSDEALEGVPVTSAFDRSYFVGVTLSYHLVLGAHLVDVRDVAPR